MEVVHNYGFTASTSTSTTTSNSWAIVDPGSTCMIIIAAVLICYVQEYSGYDEKNTNHCCCQSPKRNQPKDKNC